MSLKENNSDIEMKAGRFQKKPSFKDAPDG
jgi:hypothetical protein